MADLKAWNIRGQQYDLKDAYAREHIAAIEADTGWIDNVIGEGSISGHIYVRRFSPFMFINGSLSCGSTTDANRALANFSIPSGHRPQLDTAVACPFGNVVITTDGIVLLSFDTSARESLTPLVLQFNLMYPI